MGLIETTITLFAQNPFSHMGKNFRTGGGGLTSEVFVLFGVLIAIGLVITMLIRYFYIQDGVSYTRPRRLFRELCVAHQLTRQQQQALRKLARVHQLAQPARLFLEPGLFEISGEIPGESPVKPDSEKHAAEIAQLRESLFGK